MPQTDEVSWQHEARSENVVSGVHAMIILFIRLDLKRSAKRLPILFHFLIKKTVGDNGASFIKCQKSRKQKAAQSCLRGSAKQKYRRLFLAHRFLGPRIILRNNLNDKETNLDRVESGCFRPQMSSAITNLIEYCKGFSHCINDNKISSNLIIYSSIKSRIFSGSIESSARLSFCEGKAC